MVERSEVEGWFVAGGRIRPGWRLLAFVALFAALFTAGLFVLAYVRPVSLAGALFWQGMVLLVPALVAGWLLLRVADRLRPGALGTAWSSGTTRELWLGFLIGGGSLAVVVALLVALGFLVYEPGRGSAAEQIRALGTYLVVFATAAAAEEALFRGYGFQVLVEAVGAVAATVLASVLFAVAHLANPHVQLFAVLNIFLAGVLLSAAYLRTRSLWFATAVHTGWNWTMASVFALPVSGLGAVDTPLYHGLLTGPEFVTGGAFGPEGGLAATVAFGLAFWAVMRWPAVRPAPEIMELAPLVNRRLGAGHPMEETRG